MAYEKQKRWHRRNRWSKLSEAARRRCLDPRTDSFCNYGARGIRYELTTTEVRTLWARDGGEDLKRPSLDRRDSNWNYSFTNCRFIELPDNIAISNRIRATMRRAARPAVDVAPPAVMYL